MFDSECRFGETKKGTRYEYIAKDVLLIYTTKQDRKNYRSNRKPPINPILKASIERYLNSFTTPMAPDDWLFPAHTGSHMSYSGINNRLEKHCAKLGIDSTVINGQIGYHMIRKAFAVSIFQHFGGGLMAALKVQKQFGHSKLETTYAYLGVTLDNDLNEALATGAIYDVSLMDRINGREPALSGWMNLYQIFDESGVLDLQMTNWLRTFTSDTKDIAKTLQWMKSKQNKIDFL